MFFRILSALIQILLHSNEPEKIATLIEDAVGKESQFSSLQPGSHLELARTEVKEFGNTYDLSVVVTRTSGENAQPVPVTPFVPAPVQPPAAAPTA